MKLPFLCLLVAAHTAGAALVFTDNFDRSNTAAPNGGLGSNWDITGNIFLNSNHALTQTASSSYALYDGFDLSQSFTMSLDIYSQSNSRYAGMVFNYVDASNYYVLRASFESSTSTAWQFLKVVDGVQTTVSSGSISAGSMPLNTWRTLTLSSTANPGEYTFTLTNVGGTTTYASSTLTDSSFGISGQAGLYFSSSFAWADNYSLTTVPEPSSLALLALGGAAIVMRRGGRGIRA